ncbi:hypothetical protein CP533_1020 [Ophiocordyceps camponoti-saundersi (nom. inval.)]|nr:hypothetical protein CP533_1020 [Ophiocordyceps camponoti-saundersi (nom. inval.)]
MDAAAKTVQSLSQHILPERPHYLSNSPGWRYRDTGASRIEEWQNNRLQYMTLVSQADRGFLLTRSHYDMREEPPKPIPRALAATGDKKKKLSLSDYKNKKTVVVAASASSAAAASSSASPPDSIVAKPVPSHTSAADFRRPDALQPPSVDAKMRPPRDGAIDMRLPPKPPSLPPKPSSPPPPHHHPPPAIVKKRVVDADDDSRPLKRHKHDDGRLSERPPRDDAARRPPQQSGGKEDRTPASWNSSSLPNGRPPVLRGGPSALSSSSARNSSPGPRPRSELVNGMRPHSSASNRTTASGKLDGPKSSVPPLLSPLHLSFGESERLRSDDKRDRKRREDVVDVATSKTMNKAEPLPPPPPPPKKNRIPLVIPPLLSPTLPPAIEAELLKRKKMSSPGEPIDDRSKESRDAKKRAATAVNDHEPNKLGHRRRLIVVLSIPKALRPAVNKILAPAKEGQSRDSRAVSDEAALPTTQARKRPIGAAEGPSQVVAAAKRPRTSDMARVAPTPSTPSKKSTTMSRVSSSNSMAQTPGDAGAVNAPPHMDRRLPNGQSGRLERDISMLRDKEMQLLKRGKDLKHEWTHILKVLQSSRSQAAEPMVKLRCVLGVESLVAFVMAFQAQALWRNMAKKRRDPSVWESMFPLIEEIRGETNRLTSNSQTLSALVVLMQAVCVEEVLTCYTFIEAPSKKESDILFKHGRARARLWSQIRDLNDAITAPDLRLDLRAWYTLDDVTGLAMRLLRRWCAVEMVDWTPEPVVTDSWPIKPG